MTPARIAAVAAAVGGPVALARKLGVQYLAVRRWITGERTPRGPAAVMLERLEKRHIPAQPGFRRSLRGGYRTPKESPQ